MTWDRRKSNRYGGGAGGRGTDGSHLPKVGHSTLTGRVARGRGTPEPGKTARTDDWPASARAETPSLSPSHWLDAAATPTTEKREGSGAAADIAAFTESPEMLAAMGFVADAAEESDDGSTASEGGQATGAIPHQQQMEALFGQDFSGVVARTGRRDELAPLGAQAAAEGNVMTFADDEPDAATVAHELTHVVQQQQAGSTALAARGVVAAAHEPAEIEAEAIAAHVASGAAGPVAVTARPAGTLHLKRGTGEAISFGRQRRNEIAKQLDKIERGAINTPEIASRFRTAVAHLELEGVVTIGMQLLQGFERLERDLSWIPSHIDDNEQTFDNPLAVNGSYDDPTKADEIAALRMRYATVNAFFIAGQLAASTLVQPATFRGAAIPGVDVKPAPSLEPDEYKAFLRQNVAKTTTLVSVIDEIRIQLASLDPGAEPPRHVVDLVESWMGDRTAFLFLHHVLTELGLSAILGAKTRNGKTLDARAAQVARRVPQRADDIPRAFEDALEAHKAGDNATALELTELALERMDELGDVRKLQELSEQGGAGTAFGLMVEIVQEARGYAAAAATELRRGMSPKGNLILAERASRTAGPIYKSASGEIDYQQSGLANADDYMTASVGVSMAMFAALMMPVIVPALAEGAAIAFTELRIAAAASPELAAEVVTFAASIFVQIGEGGVDSFVESLQTPEGILSLVVDIMAMRMAGGGGHVPGGAPDPVAARGRQRVPSGKGDLRARATDIVDKIRAFGQATVDWYKNPGRVAAGAGGPDVRVPGGSLSQHYRERVDEIRAARVRAGVVTYRPTPDQRLAGYHPPKPGKTAAQFREQLAAEARAKYPVNKSMTNEERAEAYRKQVEYFEEVERHAQQEIARLTREAADVPPGQREGKLNFLNAEEEAARLQLEAARVKPVAGKLPRNHEYAGDEYKIEDIIAKKGEKNADLAEDAIQELEERGMSGVRFTEDGTPDLEPFVYRDGDVVGRVEITLSGNRDTDFTRANAEMKKRYKRWTQPPGWTWHHHETEGVMILVPRSIHDVVGHTGGAATYRHRTGDPKAYAKKRSKKKAAPPVDDQDQREQGPSDADP